MVRTQDFFTETTRHSLILFIICNDNRRGHSQSPTNTSITIKGKFTPIRRDARWGWLERKNQRRPVSSHKYGLESLKKEHSDHAIGWGPESSATCSFMGTLPSLQRVSIRQGASISVRLFASLCIHKSFYHSITPKFVIVVHHSAIRQRALSSGEVNLMLQALLSACYIEQDTLLYASHSIVFGLEYLRQHINDSLSDFAPSRQRHTYN